MDEILDELGEALLDEGDEALLDGIEELLNSGGCMGGRGGGRVA